MTRVRNMGPTDLCKFPWGSFLYDLPVGATADWPGAVVTAITKRCPHIQRVEAVDEAGAVPVVTAPSPDPDRSEPPAVDAPVPSTAAPTASPLLLRRRPASGRRVVPSQLRTDERNTPCGPQPNE